MPMHTIEYARQKRGGPVTLSSGLIRPNGMKAGGMDGKPRGFRAYRRAVGLGIR